MLEVFFAGDFDCGDFFGDPDLTGDEIVEVDGNIIEDEDFFAVTFSIELILDVGLTTIDSSRTAANCLKSS